jgi:hypothetical protein
MDCPLRLPRRLRRPQRVKPESFEKDFLIRIGHNLCLFLCGSGSQKAVRFRFSYSWKRRSFSAFSNDLKAGQRLPSTLRSRSVSESLQGEKPPPADALIAIVSCWPEFLRWSHTILVAAGVDPNALNFRDAREKGWEKGLRSTAFVITDSLMARHLPAGCDARVFRVVSDSSIAELRAYVEQFFR